VEALYATDEQIRVEDIPVVRRTEDFDVFYRSEYRSVLGLAIVLSGDRSAAEELVQDAFLAAYKAWDRIGVLDSAGAWVRRLVANRSVSRFRRMATEAKALVRLKPEPAVDSAIATEAALDIWHRVRDLPKRQAQVVALTYLEDLPRRDVAAILEISEETVKTHLERARATLATTLISQSEASHGS
jgi:RNA polymerase sigma-70 factor (ECF subfamily)